MARLATTLALLAAVAAVAVESTATATKRPNIVLFLTDDQDQMLGGSFPPKAPNGATPMTETQRLLVDGGATATNMFIHTPICCPSRSELLSGRYFHNIRVDATKPKPEPKGSDCMHVNENKFNNATFAKELHEAGYAVGMFGKYLNSVPDYVPVGFDAWLANGGGNYVAPEFATRGLEAFSGIADGRWHGTQDNYTVSVVGNVSTAWIRHVHAQNPERPFFAYIAPKAVHEPFIPAPWYLDTWKAGWPEHEPRPAPWNASAAARRDHHGTVATAPQLTADAAAVVTGVFKNRWRQLLSVDDLIRDVVALCEELGVEEHTYFLYTSDHGFQLGEFNMLMDKRHVYDWDTRIHLLARGPGIAAGSTFAQPATQVDLAPTFLDMAGLGKPARMDGHSLLPLLTGGRLGTGKGAAVAKGVEGAAPWRDSVFIEYYFVSDNDKCVHNCSLKKRPYPHSDSWCTDLDDDTTCWCAPNKGGRACYATESSANNYIAVRHPDAAGRFGDNLYAEFETGDQKSANINFEKPDFYEIYNATQDPWMMDNLRDTVDPATRAALHAKLHAWFRCAGDSCP